MADQLDLWIRINRAQTAVLHAVERELETSHGLSKAWFEVLVSLDSAPDGRRRMTELTAATSLTPSGLTRLIDRMEGSGLVKRRSCAIDRRGVEAEITAKGRETLSCARPAFVEAVERHFAGMLTPQEIKAMWSASEKVLSGHGLDPDAGCS